MSSPVKTPVEARIAHVVGTLIGIGIAVAGFLASHRGVQIPCTGLTVGTALVAVSHFRYFRVVETTVSSAVAWEKENKNLVDTLRDSLPGALTSLLPKALNLRLNLVEEAVGKALTAAQKQTPLDVEGIAQKVIATLAASSVTQPTNGPVPVKGADTSPVGSVVPSTASPFQDPPVVTS